MQILNFFETKDPEYWLSEISKSDWRAAAYLVSLIREGKIKERYGPSTQVLLLIEDKTLMAFCTYADQDEIPDPTLTPWAGFVYTFPAFRGQRRMGKLLEHIYALAKKDGHQTLYISTGETGLYEKYGFTYWKEMADDFGEPSRVYRMPIVDMDYRDVIGKEVTGTIDRPMGSAHPNYPDMIYPIHYGYVDGILAPDGEEQDVYVFGTNEPMKTFTGKIIGVIHRLNDNEDKWIVSLNGRPVSPEEIENKTAFQEQYYMHELYT